MLLDQVQRHSRCATKEHIAQEEPLHAPLVHQGRIVTVKVVPPRKPASLGDSLRLLERVKTVKIVLRGRSTTYTARLVAVSGELLGKFICSRHVPEFSHSCSGWYTDQSGQTHCFNCPNRGSFQQGWSPPGSSSSGSCVAQSGALASCSQSDSSCRESFLPGCLTSNMLISLLIFSVHWGCLPVRDSSK